MTDAEKHGKAICAECAHFSRKLSDVCLNGRSMDNRSYITGWVAEQDFEYRCEKLNPEGNCSGFRPIYEEFK
jgi:pimeloyl-CoA synthetase